MGRLWFLAVFMEERGEVLTVCEKMAWCELALPGVRGVNDRNWLV
jgi:hypothetical protein